MCLALSGLLHASALIVAQRVFPTAQEAVRPRFFAVGLLRPAPGPASEAERTALPSATPAAPAAPEVAGEAETTISLGSRDPLHEPFAENLRESILREWEYPPEARRLGLEGQVQVLFRLLPDGRLEDLSLLGPAGHPLLDDEALRSVRAAAPFSPVPPSVATRRLNVEASFVYRLGSAPAQKAGLE